MVQHFWYRRSYTFFTLLLLPLSWIFRGIVTIRRFLYRINIKKTIRFPVPVIVVGNITTGGTGKTPLVIWLARFLKSKGYRPGIVSRGVGGKKHYLPHLVTLDDSPKKVGDEALLLTRGSDCPVAICIDRPAAVSELLTKTHCNIILSDDGLQHYRLGRDVEIAVVDGERQLGNRCFIPAGPLRESSHRLSQVDFVVEQGKQSLKGFAMQLIGQELVSVKKNHHALSLEQFRGQTIHAVAAIGHPERFFALLRDVGIDVIPHAFPDHYHFKPTDFHFADALPIIMTEKDAVKCQAIADDRFWYLPVTVVMNADFTDALLAKLNTVAGEKYAG